MENLKKINSFVLIIAFTLISISSRAEMQTFQLSPTESVDIDVPMDSQGNIIYGVVPSNLPTDGDGNLDLPSDFITVVITVVLFVALNATPVYTFTKGSGETGYIENFKMNEETILLEDLG